MATITPFLDTRTPCKSALYPIVIRISIGKSQRLINTGFKIEASYWAKNAVKRNHPQASIINARLSDLQADFSRYLAECTLSGIKPFSMHQARHSFASQLMEHTDSIHVIKEALGHSDYRTTQIYLSSLSDKIIDNEVDKLYGK